MCALLQLDVRMHLVLTSKRPVHSSVLDAFTNSGEVKRIPTIRYIKHCDISPKVRSRIFKLLGFIDKL